MNWRLCCAAAIQASDEAVKQLWYRAKTALVKQGVAVPLLFRLALTSDAKNYMSKHKTRGLWKLPMRQAVAIAQGKEEVPAPKQHQRGGGSGPRGRGGEGGFGKRGRFDDDGDAVMVRSSAFFCLLDRPCFLDTCLGSRRGNCD